MHVSQTKCIVIKFDVNVICKFNSYHSWLRNHEMSTRKHNIIWHETGDVDTTLIDVQRPLLVELLNALQNLFIDFFLIVEVFKAENFPFMLGKNYHSIMLCENNMILSESSPKQPHYSAKALYKNSKQKVSIQLARHLPNRSFVMFCDRRLRVSYQNHPRDVMFT